MLSPLDDELTQEGSALTAQVLVTLYRICVDVTDNDPRTRDLPAPLFMSEAMFDLGELKVIIRLRQQESDALRPVCAGVARTREASGLCGRERAQPRVGERLKLCELHLTSRVSRRVGESPEAAEQTI